MGNLRLIFKLFNSIFNYYSKFLTLYTVISIQWTTLRETSSLSGTPSKSGRGNSLLSWIWSWKSCLEGLVLHFTRSLHEASDTQPPRWKYMLEYSWSQAYSRSCYLLTTTKSVFKVKFTSYLNMYSGFIALYGPSTLRKKITRLLRDL